MSTLRYSHAGGGRRAHRVPATSETSCMGVVGRTHSNTEIKCGAAASRSCRVVCKSLLSLGSPFVNRTGVPPIRTASSARSRNNSARASVTVPPAPCSLTVLAAITPTPMRRRAPLRAAIARAIKARLGRGGRAAAHRRTLAPNSATRADPVCSRNSGRGSRKKPLGKARAPVDPISKDWIRRRSR